MFIAKAPRPLRIVHHGAVVSCGEAAAARAIDLGQELKTLVLDTGAFSLAVHLRADTRLRARSIKRLIKLDNVHLVQLDVLARFGLYPGVINPWNVPFCRYHLLCLRVLVNPVMATNDSSLTMGRFFSTHDLLALPNLVVGFFGDSP